MTALYVRALLAVPLAHLLPDLWTGWGTRLWLPFSEQRLALDWTMVIDPWFTLPLVVAAIWSLARRAQFERAFRFALALSLAYLTFRVVLSRHLAAVVRNAYPFATSVQVFPAPLSITRLRYVARQGEDYVAGSVTPGEAPHEQARVASRPTAPLPARLTAVATIREALAWAAMAGRASQSPISATTGTANRRSFSSSTYPTPAASSMPDSSAAEASAISSSGGGNSAEARPWNASPVTPHLSQ
jgi:hypothetical protein